MMMRSERAIRRNSNLAPPVDDEMDDGVETFDLFKMSDEEITKNIYETHEHAEKFFDEDSLFLVVENVLKHSIQIAEKLARGSNVHVDNKEEISTSNSNFINVPLISMIKEIGCNLSCKVPDEGSSIFKATLEILKKLSKCTWEAKGVVTLAAFALEFGDFWHFAQATLVIKTSDQLTNSLGILKGVPVLLKSSDDKRRQEVLNLNKLINTTMDIIKILDKFEKLGDRQDIPSLRSANKQIPIYVYWAIVTIIAFSTKISILTSDQPDKHFDLYHYTCKVNSISKDLIEKLSYCNKELEEAKDYGRIKKIFGSSTEIMQSFKALTEDSVSPLIIDGFTNQKVRIDVLKKKNVFTFISSLEIPDNEITILKSVHEKTKKDDLYTIVWIPIVEKWTTELEKKFEAILTSYKMPWYVVPSIYLSVAGIKFIKEDWHFNGKPILVALNSTSGLENENAFHHIYSFGMEAYPFNREKIALFEESKWIIRSAVKGIDPSLETWFKEESYIFFYGGKNEWIEKFKTKATTLISSDPSHHDLKMVPVCGGSEKEGPNILGQFWNAIEHLFMTKVNKPLTPITREIYKLFSYEESGWGVLCKGSSVEITGHGITFFKVLEEFEQWKEGVKQNGFAKSFKNYHAKISIETGHPCTHIEVKAGNIPKSLSCPECNDVMEMVISFKCCHERGGVAANDRH